MADGAFVASTGVVALSTVGWGISQMLHDMEAKQLSKPKKLKVCIIGSGCSGIIAACKLLKNGFNDFQIFERESDLGGTWLLNTYPGCGCDIPSHSYSFSFEPNPFFSKKFVQQAELLDYYKNVAKKYGLEKKTQFETEVISCEYENDQWKVSFRSRYDQDIVKVEYFNIVVGATGQLNVPKTLEVPGMNGFKGDQMHTAKWNCKVDLANKTVVVVGTGSSAVQLVPEMEKVAKHVYVIQRSPGWVLPRGDYNFPKIVQRIFLYFPLLLKLFRLFEFLLADLVWWATIPGREGQSRSRFAESFISNFMRSEMVSKGRSDLIEKVIPKERFGCKRPLLSDSYLATICSPKVTLVTGTLIELTPTGVLVSTNNIAVDNKETQNIDCDAILWSTGFKTNDWMQGIQLRNENGVELHEYWKSVTKRPSAYYGITVPTFKNMFILYGPNTNSGSASALKHAELSVEHMINIMLHMESNGLKSCQVKQQSFDNYEAMIRPLLKDSAFAGNCTSWFKEGTDGIVVNSWPLSASHYWYYTSTSKDQDYTFT